MERENGCLGLTLRGGGEYPLIVTNVRMHGPVFKTGQIKPGDRVLRVDNVSLRLVSDVIMNDYLNFLILADLADEQNTNRGTAHSEEWSLVRVYKSYDRVRRVGDAECGVQHGATAVGDRTTDEREAGTDFEQLFECCQSERYLSQAGRSATGGDLYCQHTASQYCGSVSEIYRSICFGIINLSVYFFSCGALSVGDQILSVDETIVENSAYSPEEVTTLLDANCTKGYTQLQILPAHTLVRRRG